MPDSPDLFPPNSANSAPPRRGMVPEQELDAAMQDVQRRIDAQSGGAARPEVPGPSFRSLEDLVPEPPGPRSVSLPTPSVQEGVVPPLDIPEDLLDVPVFQRGKASEPRAWRGAVENVAPEDMPSAAPVTEGIKEAEVPEPEPPPDIDKIAPEKRPLATKLWNGLKSAGVAYWDNISRVKGREKEWYYGVAAGAVVSLSVQAATAGNPLVSSAAKFGINGVASAGLNILIGKNYNLEKETITNKYTGQELADKIKDLEDRHANAKGRVKAFMLGMSAGATYTSVVGLGLNFAGVHLDQMIQTGVKNATEGVKSAFETHAAAGVSTIAVPHEVATAVATPTEVHIAVPTETPTPTATPEPLQAAAPTIEPAHVPTAVPTETPTALPTETALPTHVPTPEPSANPVPTVEPVVVAPVEAAPVVPDAAQTIVATPDTVQSITTAAGSGVGLHEAASSNLSAEVLGTHQAFSEVVAPHVGEHLDMTTQAVNDALQAQGLDPSQVSAQTMEQMRMAAQHQLEAYGNESFAQAARETATNGQIDLSQTADRGTQLFNEALAQSDHHDKLMQAAHDALNSHLADETEMHQIVQEAIKNIPPDQVTEHAIKNGEVFADMARQAGLENPFQAIQPNADFFGAHALASFDKINDFHQQVVSAVGMSDGYHIPASQAELPGIIEKARSGDDEAMKKLIAFWRFWPAGDTVPQYSAEAMKTILQSAGVAGV